MLLSHIFNAITYPYSFRISTVVEAFEELLCAENGSILSVGKNNKKMYNGTLARSETSKL